MHLFLPISVFVSISSSIAPSASTTASPFPSSPHLEADCFHLPVFGGSWSSRCWGFSESDSILRSLKIKTKKKLRKQLRKSETKGSFSQLR